jgi:hypothetical protein
LLLIWRRHGHLRSSAEARWWGRLRAHEAQGLHQQRECRRAQPYSEDYEQTVEKARQERDAGIAPPLQATVPNIAAYATVFLGFPI